MQKSKLKLPWHTAKLGISLSLCISILLISLVLLTTFLNVYNMRKESSEIALTAAERSFQLMAENINAQVQSYITPFIVLVDTVSTLENDIEFITHDRVIEKTFNLMVNFLRSNPNLLAVNQGYNDGTYFSVTAMRNEAVRQNYAAPLGTAFVVWTVRPNKLYHSGYKEYKTFFGEDLQIIETREAPSTYDARTRPWYVDAMKFDQMIMTDPYVFTTSKQLGIAIARPFLSGDGVFSINLLLDNMNQILQHATLSGDGMLLLLDAQQRVLAHSHAEANQCTVQLSSVDEHVNPILREITANVDTNINSAGSIITINDTQYFASVSHMLLGLQKLTLVMALPVSEFTGYLDRISKNTLFFALAVLLVFIPLGVFFSRHISKPLAALASETEKVQRLDFSPSEFIPSQIFEVRQLFSSLNFMKTMLRRRTDELLHIQAELESTVAQRTSALLHALDTAEAATEAKSRFLAVMSHEIRTPLSGIIGMTDLCLHTPLDEKQEHYLENIDFAANSLLRILNDILDFSKIEAGKMSIEQAPFHLPSLLENVLSSMRAKAMEAGLELEFSLEPRTPPWISGDSLRLTQILTNLLSNAIKFTPSGVVSCTVIPAIPGHPQPVTLSARSEIVYISFIIADQGIGISPEQQKKLFTPFSQAQASTARRFGGTGLGLTICVSLLELMGGTLQLNSALGKGSTFTVCIPFKLASEPSKIPDSPIEHLAETLRHSNILLVEDDPINQEVATEFLNSLGLHVDVASDGQQALDILNAPNTYNLVLMDIQMPVMNGHDATRALRDRNYQGPIIAFSANASLQDKQESLDVGMNAHISKPLQLTELTEVLNYWLKPQPGSA